MVSHGAARPSLHPSDATVISLLSILDIMRQANQVLTNNRWTDGQTDNRKVQCLCHLLLAAEAQNKL